MTADPQTRFWAKVVRDAETGCFIWLGSNNGSYGTFFLDSRCRRAHGVAYEWTFGPVPDGLVLDHLCRLTLCVNPHHLEAVSQRENVRRGEVVKTHCIKGHPLTLANTYRGTWGRRCRDCALRFNRESQARRRLSRAS